MPQSNKPVADLPRKLTEAERDPVVEQIEQAFATTDINLQLPLLQQTKFAACCGDPLNNKMTHKYAIAAVQSLGARDGLEVLLAVQMVGVHGLAMQCLANAALKEQTDMGVDVNVNRATRLLRTFTAQVEALQKYRSKGEQRCTVEHVHVHNGGQAVVGTINQSKAGIQDDQRPGEGDEANGEQ
jgi:hypothetical protein